MKEKQIIAEHRIIHLEAWIARQPLTPRLNVVIEQTEAFRRKLRDWVEDTNPHTVAPTFHYAAGVC